MADETPLVGATNPKVAALEGVIAGGSMPAAVVAALGYVLTGQVDQLRADMRDQFDRIGAQFERIGDEVTSMRGQITEIRVQTAQIPAIEARVRALEERSAAIPVRR